MGDFGNFGIFGILGIPGFGNFEIWDFAGFRDLARFGNLGILGFRDLREGFFLCASNSAGFFLCARKNPRARGKNSGKTRKSRISGSSRDPIDHFLSAVVRFCPGEVWGDKSRFLGPKKKKFEKFRPKPGRKK